MLEGVGEEGQKKLLASRVLVVGAGGLGSPVLYYLAAAGVGRLGIVDSDRVDLSNLQRQIIHFTSDLGRRKVESARDKLSALNPRVGIDTYDMEITDEDSAKLVAEYDLVVMAVDNFSTRQTLNKVCFTCGKPLIEGAVGGFSGHVTTFLPPTGPCYQCLFPKEDGEEQQKQPIHGRFAPARTPSTAQEASSGRRPRESREYWGTVNNSRGEIKVLPEGVDSSAPGVIGALPGVIGALQAGEALKVILGIGTPLLAKLLIFDFMKSEFRTLRYTRAQNCKVCR